MIQKREESRPFAVHSRVGRVGRTSVMADCPFCGAHSVIYLWSFAGSGKKACPCGAMFTARDGGTSVKLVEVAA